MEAENDTHDGANKLQIPFSSIEDHIQCSICLSSMRGAVLTPCGHRYCIRCISEWVGRNHTCPCCNSPLNTGQFYFDVQFDGLVDAVLTERDKAEEEYYNKVFGSGSTENQTFNHRPTAFENILKKHMKASMLSHQRYFDNLRGEFERKLKLLENGISSASQWQNQVNGASIEDIKAELAKNLDDSERLAAEAFDKYLQDNVPKLELVPVTVSVYIADKDIRIEDIVIAPSNSLSVIKPVVENVMKQRSNDILSWEEEQGVKLLFGPLVKNNTYNIEGALSNLGDGQSIVPIQWDSKLVLQHSMRPGSEIVLSKVFRCQSDLPKQCFAAIYVQGAQQACDYFTCTKCSVNWICKSCIQCCHQGHSIRPFAMNHSPSWACCYCPKKKLCHLQTVMKKRHDTPGATAR